MPYGSRANMITDMNACNERGKVSISFGGSVNYATFSVDGVLTMSGNARAYNNLRLLPRT